MRRSILSSLRAHLGRLIAACLAIVLGVGFGTLAMTAHASASHGIDETIGAQYAGVDAVAYPENGEIKPAHIAGVRQLPQTASAVTMTTAFMEVSYPGLVRPTSLPINSLYDTTRIAGPGASSGRLPTATNEIALAAKLAAKHKVSIGQSLRISSYDNKSWDVTVTGLLDDSKAVGSASAVATPAALKIFEPGGSIRTIAVAAKPSVDQQAMAAAVQSVVSKDLKDYTGADWIQHEVQGY
ncbi:MAG TPA: ABC transporter permease, partial [Kribbella sp.]|nr:ABC transporter permease [Kribbella sp.]